MRSQMLQRKSEHLPTKALGALGFAVWYLFWRFFGHC